MDAQLPILKEPISVELETVGRYLYLLGQWQNHPRRIPRKEIIKFCYSLFLPHSVPQPFLKSTHPAQIWMI